MEKLTLKGISRAGLALALFVAAAGANAAGVVYTNVIDGNGSSSLFDTATTVPSGVMDEILTIGLDNFVADGTNPLSLSAVDTLSMTITAPTGFFITSISYTEAGFGETTNGVAIATGSIIADGTPVNFLSQLFAPNAISGWTITPGTIAIDNKDSIAVSITNSLFAFAFGPNDLAIIEKESAVLTVGLTAIPIPPAIWMMGAAITALVTVSRRGGASA